jgi:electron transport complex protein RnfG
MPADATLRPTLGAGAVLAVTALCAAALVAFTERAARPQIEANTAAALRAELAVLVPADLHDQDLLADTVQLTAPALTGSDAAVTVYRAAHAGVPTAAAFEVVAPDGYAGAIRLLVAVTPEGRVLGVRVISHRETPGLGDYIEARRSPWIRGFDGKALGEPPAARWAVRKDGGDFDAMTGATVTPRAIVKAVRRALEQMDAQRAVLFPVPSGESS